MGYLVNKARKPMKTMSDKEAKSEVIVTPVPKPVVTPVKPGYKTTEFWLAAVATLVGLLFASGAVGEGTGLEKALAYITSALTSFGYSVSRGMTKKQ